MVAPSRLGAAALPAIVAGIWCGALGLSPTGSAVVDVVLVGVAAAVCAWCAARAPWWALVAAAGLGAAFARDLVGLAVAAAAGAAGGRLGSTEARDTNAELIDGAAAAAVVVALCRLDVPGPFGLESAVAVPVGLALVAFGLARRGRVAVRRGAMIGGLVLAVAALATAVFAATALSSRDDLERGELEVRRGLDALADGEVDEAATRFELAAELFGAADRRLGRPWNEPARLVPVVAQHRETGAMLAARAAAATEQVRSALDAIDLDALRWDGGRIDLAELDQVRAEVTELQGVLVDLDGELDELDSPWLVSPVRSRLQALDADVADYREQGELAVDGLRILPGLLGADDPKVYFVAFVTPAEARGSIGLMGNWAELTIDDGRMSMTAFGRHADLRAAGDPTTWRIEGMPEFVDRYGRVGFAEPPDGTADPEVWPIITMSPHFPSTAEVISQLYPQSGGQPIDGVIALDPAVIAALLEFTGPIDVDGLPLALDHRNAERYLVLDQYVDFDGALPDRIDALEVLGQAAFERLLDGSLGDPVELGRSLGPLAADRHLAVWLADDEAQTVVAELDLDHSLPAADGRDGVVVAFNNGTGNKIEGFLATDVTYRRTVDAAQSRVDGHVTIEVTNDAPANGLPQYVIGNDLGLPNGTNRLIVSVYTTGPAESLTVDGEPAEFAVGAEQGWPVVDLTVLIPPGATRVIEVDFATPTKPGAGEPVVVLPNLPGAPTLTVETTGGVAQP